MPDMITEKLDQIAQGVKAAQDISSRNSERLDALDKIQIEKIVDETSKIAEKMQELDQKAKAIEESNKVINDSIKVAFREKNDGTLNLTDADQKAADEFFRYMKSGVQLTEEIVSNICEDIARKTFKSNDAAAIDFYKKDLIRGVNPDGGYWVRPIISSRILTRLFETSPVRLVATVENIAGDILKFVIDDNEVSSAGWVGEGDPRTLTDTSKIGELNITVHEQYAMPRATQKMLDNVGFDIEQWLTRKITEKFIRVENSAFVVGDGSKKPRGFLSYDPWSVPGVYERGKIEQINSGDATQITADSLEFLQNSLLEDYQPNAVFMLKRKTWGSIVTLKNGQGSYLINPYLLAEGKSLSMLGKRVIFANDMPEIAANSLPVVYGDFATGYTIIDQLGIRLLRDAYTQKGYVLFYTTKYVGGDVTNYQCLKILKIAD